MRDFCEFSFFHNIKKKVLKSQSKGNSKLLIQGLYQGTRHPRLDKEVPLTSQHASVDMGEKQVGSVDSAS